MLMFLYILGIYSALSYPINLFCIRQLCKHDIKRGLKYDDTAELLLMLLLFLLSPITMPVSFGAMINKIYPWILEIQILWPAKVTRFILSLLFVPKVKDR